MAKKLFLEPKLELETFATEEILNNVSGMDFGTGDFGGAQDWD